MEDGQGAQVASSRASDRIEARASFDFVRYANCWEDAHVLCEALDARPGMRILSVASAGDNTLALLGEGAEVVAADVSAAQLACLELRCAAFRRLDHAGVLAFLGVRRAEDRPGTYAALAPDLSPWARRFWDTRRGDIAAGVIHCGKFERFFRLFRRRVLPLIHSARTVERLLEEKDPQARTTFYERSWNTWRWKLLFRLFFSRFMIGRFGRDPEFFRYVEGSVADRILARTRYALTVLPTHANPYLDYALTGAFRRALPRYLEPHRFEAIRRGIDRLTLGHGSAEEVGRIHAGDGFDAFNLSDIFEYLSPPTFREIYEALLAVARPGARLAYWNTLVPRRCPVDLAPRVAALTTVAEKCFAGDLAFFYCAFVAEEVR